MKSTISQDLYVHSELFFFSKLDKKTDTDLSLYTIDNILLH